MRGAAGILGAALALGLLAGCGSSHGTADKAGGATGPVVLRLAVADAVDQPDTGTIRDFAARVARLSGGKVHIRVTFQAAGDRTPDAEVRTIQLVRSGRYDIGWSALARGTSSA